MFMEVSVYECVNMFMSVYMNVCDIVCETEYVIVCVSVSECLDV